MKYTNDLNLPDALVQAIINVQKEYSRGDADISVTGLINPIRQFILFEKNYDEITVDVSDLIFSFLGSLMHSVLERSAPEEGTLVEKRFFIQVDGVKISGQVDYITKVELGDWKLASAYEAINGLKQEKIMQINLYRYMAKQHGFDLNKLIINMIFRDWSKRKARITAGYPKKQVREFVVPIIPDEEIVRYLKERVSLYKQARAGDVPTCTVEERWATKTKYAVMKKGKSRADKLCDTFQEATDLVSRKGSGYYVEARVGESVRCEDYCDVKNFCTQYKKIAAKQGEI